LGSSRAAWSVAPGTLWGPPPASTSAWAWTTDSAVIVPQTGALTAYATADGTRQWSVALPRPVCAIADAPNEAGIGAVLLSGGTRVNSEACGAVAAVDVAAGKLLWTRSLRGTSEYGMTDVQVGPDAVAVTNRSDRALTFSVGDGRALLSLPRGDSDGCEHAFASDGRIVVDGDQHTDRAAFVGYDAVSGRRRWSIPVRARDFGRPTPERVIAGAPLVIDASVDGRRFLYRLDPQARTATPFGREADDSFPPLFTQRVGDDIVVQYGRSPIMSAYDPASGKEVSQAALGDGGSAFGQLDGAVVATAAASQGRRDAGVAVRSIDPVSGAQLPLGTVRLDSIAAAFGRGTGFDLALSSRTMIVRVGGSLRGYRLGAPQ
jgi:outer membrane protein assembly factor BamB